jgi:hypothetical protein
MRRAVALFALTQAILAAAAIPGRAQVAEFGVGGSLTVPATDVLRLVRGQINGSELRLHTLGDDPTTGFHSRDQSYLRIGRTGRRVALDLPSIPLRLGANRAYAYLINDIRSNGIGVSGVGDRLRLTIRFEDEGPEFVGRCTTKPIRWYPVRAWHWLSARLGNRTASEPPAMPTKMCAAWTGADLMPLLEWQSPSLTVDFMLSARAGELELSLVEPTVGGTIVPAGSCRVPQVCDALRIATDLVRQRVAEHIQAHFDAPAFKAVVRARLARAVHARNRYAWLTRITSANFQHGSVVVSVVVDRTRIAMPRTFPLPDPSR